LQPLGRSKLLNTDHVDNGDGVESQVTSITELAADGEVPKHRIDGTLVVSGKRSSLEMLYEFSNSEDLSCCAELLLNGIVGIDGGLGAVGAVKIPGVEAGEVLQSTQDLVTTDCEALAAVSSSR
jgi:hypothetical protein